MGNSSLPAGRRQTVGMVFYNKVFVGNFLVDKNLLGKISLGTFLPYHIAHLPLDKGIFLSGKHTYLLDNYIALQHLQPILLLPRQPFELHLVHSAIAPIELPQLFAIAHLL
jgi:hypothetical protein